MVFAARLRQERLRRHLSQETLAEALGVSARTISRWEQGQGMPQAILRVRLSSYLDLSPEAFLDESETLASLMRKDAEEPDEAFSQALPALAEDGLRDHAPSVSISQDSQDTKVSGRSTSRQPFYRRSLLLGLGVFGLLVLAIGSLAALSTTALKGMTPGISAFATMSPSASIGLTAAANHGGSPSASGTALSNDNRGTYICWGSHVHLPALCMGLKDDKFSGNQPISLSSSHSGKGLGWNISIQGNVTSIWPFTASFLNTKYRGDTVAYFEKTVGGAGHNGCVGIHANVGLAWEPCGRSDTYWVISAYGYLVSVTSSNKVGSASAAGVCNASNDGSISVGVEHKPDQCLGAWSLLL